ncbi:hypothetical protein Poli38472_005170 [Pythium oligandrum]|uniref:MRH domain-containing protein n=1 Tax=Pythium oligandrum TaxID=41045 RepID=A0A8K1FK82_PYTOL|nr:hypothetical protein Poli38472_005170 [Pythium oligandrum]|eukprot:TMW62552.1 hypothetical protein Poli38472_005170 [Pythium oligandrum]
MRLGFTTLVAALAALSAHAQDTNSGLIDGVFRYGFSECVDNTRSLYYYTDDELTCSAETSGAIARPPVHGLRCDVVCDKGYFLGANFTGSTPASGCEKCPKGQYSLGGGRLYSKRTKAWTNPLPLDIRTECVTRNLYTNQWQDNCHPWKASADGSMISSGDNKNILENFEAARLFSSLRISATFVRNGTITFQYRVSAEPPYDGLIFGVDDKTVMPLTSHTDGWEEAVFDVKAGAHTFSWDYTKDFSGDSGDDKAFIKVIELVGTSFSDTYCHPCGSDVTMTGGSLCAFCKANEYAAPRSESELEFVCQKCPKDRFSPKGSIGWESCVERRGCSSEDVMETFTPCVDGKRNATFSWSEPKTCDESLPHSSPLPKPKIDLPCDECPTGLVLNDEGECEKCPIGERLSDSTCSKCPAGEVVTNALVYGRGTKDGWSEWPSIVDVKTAKRSGWKLTRDGILFSPQTTGHSSTLPTRFPLPFNVTFLHSATIEIMYALENVPTFENDGVRAWLEIEMEDENAGLINDKTGDTSNEGAKTDDNQADVDADGVNEQIIHLSNGGVNGTTTEKIPLNITARATKQFRLVLRTTGPKAAAMIRAKIMYLRLLGTEEGPGVACGFCPDGYQAIHSSDFNGCRICPAGTYAASTSGVTVCEKCPMNTWSTPGATECSACGANTFSVAGANACSAPSRLAVNATGNATTGPQVSYNLELLQSLVWGNLSDAYDLMDIDDEEELEANFLLGTSTVTPFEYFKVDEATTLLSGVFQPLGPKWKKLVHGQFVEELVDTEKDRPYIIQLHLVNSRDAGGLFQQDTGRYGEVQCSVPAQWKVTSGGNRMEVAPRSNGTGLTVSYTGGTPCKNGRPASTTINFICDLTAGAIVRPQSAKRDSHNCHVDVEWKTAFACPVCDESYFNEMKTSCSEGKQSVSYTSIQACFGGKKPASVPITTCSDVVLDTEALFKVYAVVAVISIVVLLLLGALMVMHRKYRSAYNDYMYLKGKLPVDETIHKDGTKESTFEFSPNPNSLQSSRTPGGPMTPVLDHDDEKKEEEAEFAVTSV